MDQSKNELDKKEQKIQKLADDINPTDNEPDSLAEATTAPLADDSLGGHATQADIKNCSKG